jgi:hypothetical protein
VLDGSLLRKCQSTWPADLKALVTRAGFFCQGLDCLVSAAKFDLWRPPYNRGTPFFAPVKPFARTCGKCHHRAEEQKSVHLLHTRGPTACYLLDMESYNVETKQGPASNPFLLQKAARLSAQEAPPRHPRPPPQAPDQPLLGEAAGRIRHPVHGCGRLGRQTGRPNVCGAPTWVEQ